MTNVTWWTRQKWRMKQPGYPTVTVGILAVTVAVFLLQYVTGLSSGPVTSALAYHPYFSLTEPWRALTYALVHASLLHILFNGYSLFVLGLGLEQAIGHSRFLAVYLLSAIGGAAGILLSGSTSWVVGASGAIFGLMGVFVVLLSKAGARNPQFFAVVAINLGMGFFLPGISWQAHVGGFLTGLILGLGVHSTRFARKPLQRWWPIIFTAVLLLVLTLAGGLWIWPALVGL